MTRKKKKTVNGDKYNYAKLIFSKKNPESYLPPSIFKCLVETLADSNDLFPDVDKEKNKKYFNQLLAKQRIREKVKEIQQKEKKKKKDKEKDGKKDKKEKRKGKEESSKKREKKSKNKNKKKRKNGSGDSGDDSYTEGEEEGDDSDSSTNTPSSSSSSSSSSSLSPLSGNKAKNSEEMHRQAFLLKVKSIDNKKTRTEIPQKLLQLIERTTNQYAVLNTECTKYVVSDGDCYREFTPLVTVTKKWLKLREGLTSDESYRHNENYSNNFRNYNNRYYNVSEDYRRNYWQQQRFKLDKSIGFNNKSKAKGKEKGSAATVGSSLALGDKFHRHVYHDVYCSVSCRCKEMYGTGTRNATKGSPLYQAMKQRNSFLEDFKLQPVGSEVVVNSERIRIGTKIDEVAIQTTTNKVWHISWKTGYRPETMTDFDGLMHYAQLYLERYMLEKHGVSDVHSVIVYVLCDSGGNYVCKTAEEGFLPNDEDLYGFIDDYSLFATEKLPKPIPISLESISS